MGSKLSQYDYSILTLKCVNLIQEKTPSYLGYLGYSGYSTCWYWGKGVLIIYN